MFSINRVTQTIFFIFAMDMNSIEQPLQEQNNTKDRKTVWLLMYTLLLLFPALLINLGLMPLILDEGTRADVSMEMVLSGNYIAPTINGEFYYNKPPLFNWLQILFAQITGNFSEFTLRIPVVVTLLLFAFTVYLTQKKDIGKSAAFLAGMAVITCGRILFYDSFKGLIDITFSWVIYLQFWSVYYFFRRKEYYNLFLMSYLFTTLAFMMKGLPALVFQGITLLTWFAWNRRFKRLFSLEHVSGFLLFAVIVVSYFLVYNRHNSLTNYFTALVTESTKRTFLENPLGSSIKHLFTFPVEFLFHFLPWTLFVLVFLNKGSGRFAWKNEMVRFMILTFSANILVYWVSPAIYARYLFMFLPLVFGSSFYVLFRFTTEKIWILRYGIKLVFLLAAGVISAGIVIFPLFIDTGNYEAFWWKYALTILLLIPVIILYFLNRRRWIFVFLPLLLVSQGGFQLFCYTRPHSHRYRPV